MEKHNIVIRSFDEFISLKADKTSIQEVYRYCDERFESKGSLKLPEN